MLNFKCFKCCLFQDDLEDLIVNWDESKSIGDIILKYVSILVLL